MGLERGRGNGRSACARCAHGFDCRNVWSDAKMNEGLLRGLEFKRRTVLIPKRMKRASHQQANARAQVRSPDALPYLLRLAQRVNRATDVAFGQRHGAL